MKKKGERESIRRSNKVSKWERFLSNVASMIITYSWILVFSIIFMLITTSIVFGQINISLDNNWYDIPLDLLAGIWEFVKEDWLRAIVIFIAGCIVIKIWRSGN